MLDTPSQILPCEDTEPIAILPSSMASDSLPIVRKLYPDISPVWRVGFSVLDMEQTIRLAQEIIELRTPEYFVTANLNYLMLMERYPQLLQVNRDAAAILADGFPMVLRSRFNPTRLPCRVAGSDLVVELARVSQECGYRIFFLGAAEGVAAAAAHHLKQRFPRMEVAGCYSPPFRPLSHAEHQSLIARINESDADILLVAFGQPKGELWIFDNLHQLKVPLSIQLGASFDFLAGTARRAPRFFQRLGLEWLYRTCQDPKRLAPRYLANFNFLLKMLSQDTAGLFSDRVNFGK